MWFKFLIAVSVLLLAMSGRGSDPVPFDLGHGETHFKWGVEVPLKETESDFRLRIGTRLQAAIEDKKVSAAGGGSSPQQQDSYVRRARLQVEAKVLQDTSFYMDVRADKVDRGNDGENSFALGDAFLQVKNLFNQKALKLRLFRAKYDVSRSQTVSSSRLLVLHRASISDYSAEYISKARRGTNVQILGNWGGRVTTQIVAGDSIQESCFLDSMSRKTATLNSQNFAYGGRLRVSPFAGWEEKKLTETQFGRGQHFTLGAGAFFVDNINFSNAGNTTTAEIDRSLYNFDLTFHYGPLSVSGEYFVFEGMVEDFSAATINTGKSEGWVGQMEYVLTGFHHLSPFVRVQNWNRFKANVDFDQSSWMGGLNYYMRGNKLRVGAYVEHTDYGEGLTATTNFADSDRLVGMSLMMHY